MTTIAPLTSAQRMMIASIQDLCIDVTLQGKHEAHCHFSAGTFQLSVRITPAGAAFTDPESITRDINLDANFGSHAISREQRYREITTELGRLSVELRNLLKPVEAPAHFALEPRQPIPPQSREYWGDAARGCMA